MKKKLILHIGLHKTGTTYLQRLLIENRALLNTHDVGLAKHVNDTRGHHHLLVRALRENKQSDVFDAIDESPESTVIISSEAFTHWLQRATGAKNFCQQLRERYTLNVVLFLRRQDYLKESIFAEVASKWYRGNIQNENHYQYDFEQLLSQLEQLFGRDALQPRVYRDDVANTLLTDFLSAAQLDIPIDDIQSPPPQRVSLSRRKVLLLSKIDKKKPGYEHIHATVRGSNSIKNDGIKFLLSPTERRQFLSTFRDSNRRISEKFDLGCGDYLNSESGIDDNWKAVKPLSYQEYADLLESLTDKLI